MMTYFSWVYNSVPLCSSVSMEKRLNYTFSHMQIHFISYLKRGGNPAHFSHVRTAWQEQLIALLIRPQLLAAAIN